MAEFTVTVIGSGSAIPMHGRHPSAQVVQYEDTFCLIDCGEGTQTRFSTLGIKPFKINVILISHLHGDHVFGLPGLLSSFSHLQRKEPLTVFGPPGIKGLLDAITHFTALKINFPLEIIETDATQLVPIFEKGNLEILTFPLQHRVQCNGYLLREKNANIRLRKEVIEALHLRPDQIHLILQGMDIELNGRFIPNSDLTYGQESKLSYAYCSDTEYSEAIIPWIRKVSVLYHETTFDDSYLEMARLTGHSTAGEAGHMASIAAVSCLLTGHYSSRYKDVAPLIEQAKVHFPNVVESLEGKKYAIRSLAEQQYNKLSEA